MNQAAVTDAHPLVPYTGCCALPGHCPSSMSLTGRIHPVKALLSRGPAQASRSRVRIWNLVNKTPFEIGVYLPVGKFSFLPTLKPEDSAQIHRVLASGSVLRARGMIPLNFPGLIANLKIRCKFAKFWPQTPF
jgi:hypothetical protein